MKPREKIILCRRHGYVKAKPKYDLVEGGATVYRCPNCEKEATR